MVGGTVLSHALIEMIESVISTDQISDSCRVMLKSLLNIFKMDQAACFEKAGADFKCVLALDRSNRILKGDHEIFSSQTLLNRSFLTMEPLNIHLANEQDLPNSVKDDHLKQIICLPLTRNPATVIFLGSRSLAGRNFTDEEMGQFKTAARAAWLAIRQVRMQESLTKTQDELQSLREGRRELIYSSAKMSSLLEELDRVSRFNISILLAGESGVGKEELARFIHQKSERAGSFVAVNCANLSESLLESELFGYVRGAFTGANQNKDGLFKAADRGTLFLDEIGELPLNLQPKLLRAIQERCIRPVGSTKDITVDVRLLAATHKNLERDIESGKFRSDLYYRIQEFCVEVPALRQRAEDIEFLAEHFIAMAALEMKLPPKKFSSEALKKLNQHTWPGNIRELKSICRTAVILARENEIQAADLRIISNKPPSESTKADNIGVGDDSIKKSAEVALTNVGNLRNLSREFERGLVKELLARGLSQVEIGTKLGVSVRTLQRILSDSPVSDSDSKEISLL